MNIIMFRKYLIRIICAFIPSKNLRINFRKKYYYGAKILCNQVDSFIPKEVVEKVNQTSNEKFIELNKTIRGGAA